MNRVKEFCSRGLMCMGFGPIVYGVVMLILKMCGVDTASDGVAIFKCIISTSIMAFVIAGISIIWKEDKMQLGVKIATHFLVLYFAYLVIYLLNDWIIKDFKVIGIFTLVFIIGYVLIWLIIFLTTKISANKLNKQIK